MLSIDKGQDQGFDPTTARQDMGGVRGDQGVDARGPLKVPSYPQDQRYMGDGRQATSRNRHADPP